MIQINPEDFSPLASWNRYLQHTYLIYLPLSLSLSLANER